LGREIERKLDRRIRTRRKARENTALSAEEIGDTDEGRRRKSLLELARANEQTPKVLSAKTLVSGLFARRGEAPAEALARPLAGGELAGAEARAGALGGEAASRLRSAIAQVAYHAVHAGFGWQSARHRRLEWDYLLGRRRREQNRAQSPEAAKKSAEKRKADRA